MTLNEIELKTNRLGLATLDYENLLNEIIICKKECAAAGNEIDSKRLWIIQQMFEIHKDYNLAFKLLKEKKYYDAWCKLENIEIDFHYLKKHFSFDKSQYKLYFIEKSVRNLQVLFPYRIFSSMEILEKEKKCSICGKILKFRSPCEHKIGEIYGGELCIREISDFELLGIALVENPVNKYTVPFTTNPETNERVDHYDYGIIDYLMSIVKNTYEPWDLIVYNKLLPHSSFNQTKEEDPCPCGSGENYQECCLKQAGVKSVHFRFIVKQLPKNTNMKKKKKRKK